MDCCVCESEIQSPVYRSGQNTSITSLCQVLNITTTVYYCDRCGHIQTKGIENVDVYYDENYKLSNDSVEEDQLYAVVDGQKIYRTEHQINTLMNKVGIHQKARVLDYGSAKGALLKGLRHKLPDIQIHLFDVTEEYLLFWEKLVSPEQWSTYKPKESWQGSFDLVTSFFVMEHIEDPKIFLRNIRNLLCDAGIFYCVVPNVYRNIADFVVVDHVNHFSESSLNYLFESCGFQIVEIDVRSHNNAIIIISKKSDKEWGFIPSPTMNNYASVVSLSKYWNDFSSKIMEFENRYSEHKVAIYGAGFYGTFIYSCLKFPERITCFVDQNPFLQGKELFGIAIVPPDRLPDSVDTVYVGLNPLAAESIIKNIEAWSSREIHFFIEKTGVPML
ncbi:class I SAM-dependent methyltransferase [Cohnella suwonensis]|uniref:Class I SAM-dependent methyltransferase n=1 Tax=Cohnella suwonensis TaxID=696072 RepID=A0ABW0LV09_9BACL